ncbi:MAG TPA: hypothetical protein P5104_08040 [Bacteroidales bacterium]|nr:hypothetical protein [Bacteroidales bacterium]
MKAGKWSIKAIKINICTLKRWILMIFSGIFMLSCTDDYREIITGENKFLQGKGVFIINEGNFGSGNGSLSFLNLDSLVMQNNIFYSVNKRPLGDVPYSMIFSNDDIFLVVNNSSKIEVMSRSDLSSKATLTGFTSPRFILKVSEVKAYISDFYSSRIAMLNLESGEVSGYIQTGRSSENMVLAGGKVFVAFWSNYAFPELINNMVMIIDPVTDQLIDSVQVGKEPNSMVVDKNGRVWVLCSGGFLNKETPAFHCIDPVTLDTEHILYFSEIKSYPTSLCINGNGDSLFYLNRGVFGLSVDAEELPDQPLISQDGRLFYSLGINPVTSELFVTDAVDYQQQGRVLHFSATGQLKNTYSAGIIPGRLVFSVGAD